MKPDTHRFYQRKFEVRTGLETGLWDLEAVRNWIPTLWTKSNLGSEFSSLREEIGEALWQEVER